MKGVSAVHFEDGIGRKPGAVFREGRNREPARRFSNVPPVNLPGDLFFVASVCPRGNLFVVPWVDIFEARPPVNSGGSSPLGGKRKAPGFALHLHGAFQRKRSVRAVGKSIGAKPWVSHVYLIPKL